jgi:hypothetical protein
MMSFVTCVKKHDGSSSSAPSSTTVFYLTEAASKAAAILVHLAFGFCFSSDTASLVATHDATRSAASSITLIG